MLWSDESKGLRFALLFMVILIGYGSMDGYKLLSCVLKFSFWIENVDWINHGMGIRDVVNSVWIIDPPLFSFFVCTVKYSLQHL